MVVPLSVCLMSKKIHTVEETEELRGILGPRLKAARRAMGLTQEEAAREIGISAEFYARMERGNALPSVETLVKMAHVLQVSADHLLGGDKAAQPVRRALSAPKKDSRQVSYIVDKARVDPELRRLIIGVLKLCEKRSQSD